MKRSQPKRDWREAQAKLEDEAECRFCGKGINLEKCHISGRKYDQPHPERPESSVLWVNPLDIVILDGPSTDSGSCHYKFDHGLIDLQEFLTVEEQARCVEVLGGIENARMRLAPSDYSSLMREARVLARVAEGGTVVSAEDVRILTAAYFNLENTEDATGIAERLDESVAVA